MYKELEVRRYRSKYVFTEVNIPKGLESGRQHKIELERTPEGDTYLKMRLEVIQRKKTELVYRCAQVREAENYIYITPRACNSNDSLFADVQLKRVYIESGIISKTEIVSLSSLLLDVTYSLSFRHKRDENTCNGGEEYISKVKEECGVQYKLEKGGKREEKERERLKDTKKVLELRIPLYHLKNENQDTKKQILKNKIQGLDLSPSGEIELEELEKKCYKKDESGKVTLEMPLGVRRVKKGPYRKSKNKIDKVTQKIQEGQENHKTCVSILKILDSMLYKGEEEEIEIEIQGGYLGITQQTMKSISNKTDKLRVEGINTTLKVSECKVGGKHLREMCKEEDKAYVLSKRGTLREKKDDIYIYKLTKGEEYFNLGERLDAVKRGYGPSKYIINRARYYGISMKTIPIEDYIQISNNILDYTSKAIKVDIMKEELYKYLLKVVSNYRIVEKLNLTEEEIVRYKEELRYSVESLGVFPKIDEEKNREYGLMMRSYQKVLKLEVDGEKYILIRDIYELR